MRKYSSCRAILNAPERDVTSFAYEQNASRDIARPQAAENSHRILAVHDRLRRVAHRFDVIAGLEEGDDTAGTTFESLIAPGKRPNQRALVEHELDVAAEILGVQQSLLEGPVVKRKHVGHDPAFGLLVDVFEGAEELARRLAVELDELRGQIWPHGADRSVHGVIARSRVHAPPLDLFFQHPMQGVEIGARVVAEVFHEILPRLALVMAMPTRVQKQDVAVADIGAGALDDLRRDHGPVRARKSDV